MRLLSPAAPSAGDEWPKAVRRSAASLPMSDGSTHTCECPSKEICRLRGPDCVGQAAERRRRKDSGSERFSLQSQDRKQFAIRCEQILPPGPTGSGPAARNAGLQFLGGAHSVSSLQEPSGSRKDAAWQKA